MKHHHEEVSPAHTKIMRLLASLQEEEPQKEDAFARKMEDFKTTIYDQRELLQDKFNSLNGTIKQLDKKASDTSQQKVRMMEAYSESLREVEHLCCEKAEELSERVERQKRSYIDQIISQKMKLAREQEAFNSKSLVEERQMQELIKHVRNDLHQKATPNFKQMQIKSKIQHLTKEVNQLTSASTPNHDIVRVSERVRRLLGEQEETLNRNFDMHCQALQKLIASISERLE